MKEAIIAAIAATPATVDASCDEVRRVLVLDRCLVLGGRGEDGYADAVFFFEVGLGAFDAGEHAGEERTRDALHGEANDDVIAGLYAGGFFFGWSFLFCRCFFLGWSLLFGWSFLFSRVVATGCLLSNLGDGLGGCVGGAPARRSYEAQSQQNCQQAAGSVRIFHVVSP